MKYLQCGLFEFRSHANNERLDLVDDSRSSTPARSTSIEFLGNQLPMPCQKCVRGHEGIYLPKNLAAKRFGFQSKAPALFIGVTYSFAREVLLQDFVFPLKIVDDHLLLTIHQPARHIKTMCHGTKSAFIPSNYHVFGMILKGREASQRPS